MPHSIAPATPKDLTEILELLERAGLPRAGLDRHLSTTLVARDTNGICGTAALEVYGASALLRSVAVSPERRGEGLGQALTAAALDLARARNVRRVYLLTETAGRFFPRFGFREIRRRDVDPAVLRSEEFTSACPDTALVMETSRPAASA